jgi:ABC transporter substrate binding protein (PQQ-dependent alcohol dehydrogenase system)
LRTVGARPFELSNDPRERTRNNVALLTASTRDYDVVILADRQGEFGRYVPFATSRARPVMGSAGLVAATWHWAFERFGAPQLNGRFVRATDGRHMSGADWAAWVAVKVIVQARVRADGSDFDTLSKFLKGSKIRIDGFKGVALSFRPWNNQLRQPLLLAARDAVIATAPVEGFLHQTNDLDTLGVDKKENTCRFE